MDKIFLSLQSSKLFGDKCAVTGCENEGNEINRIKKLRGAQVYESALKIKQISLCTYHYRAWHNKKIGLNDIDSFWT
jgi:hypothetical protein